MTPIGFSQYYNNNYQFPASQAGSSYSIASSNGLDSNSNGFSGDIFQLQNQQNGFMNQTQNPMEMMMQMMQMMMSFMMQMMQMFMGMMGGMMPGMSGQQGQQFGNTGQFPSANYPQNTCGSYPGNGTSGGFQGVYPGSYGNNGTFPSNGSSGAFAYAGPNGACSGAYGGNGAGGNSYATAQSNGSGSSASASSSGCDYSYQMNPGTGAVDKSFPENVSRWSGLIEDKAKKYGLDPNLVASVIQQESRGNPNARSHCGAQGLMQLMPATSREMGCYNPRNPEQNVDAGCKYLSKMLKKTNGNVPNALAAYNAGYGNVKKYGGVPPFSETRKYVKNITNNYQKASRKS